jgi:hypothetical protein
VFSRSWLIRIRSADAPFWAPCTAKNPGCFFSCQHWRAFATKTLRQAAPLLGLSGASLVEQGAQEVFVNRFFDVVRR